MKNTTFQFKEVSHYRTVVTDDRGGLVEINPGERTEISPLNQNGSSIFFNEVLPHFRVHAPENLNVAFVSEGISDYGLLSDLTQMRDVSGLSTEGRHLIFPDFSRRGYGVNTSELKFVRDHFPNSIVVNGNYSDPLFMMNKALQIEIASLAGAQGAPRTNNHMRPQTNEQMDDIIHTTMEDFAGRDLVVIKPVDECQGKGVLVVLYKEIPDTIQTILSSPGSKSPKINSWAENYWRLNPFSMFQIQDYAEGHTVPHRGHEWSATRRIVWSAISGTDTEGDYRIAVTPHGAFDKLPRKPIPEGNSITKNELLYENIVSFSPHGFEHVREFFWNMAGNGKRILVDHDEMVGDSSEIQAHLEAVFTMLDAQTPQSLYTLFALSADPVRRALAQEMKSQFWPTNKDGVPRIPNIEGTSGIHHLLN